MKHTDGLGIKQRQQQDGMALQVLHKGQYLLVHGQTVYERARTLALLRQWRKQSRGRKVGDLAAHLN